MLYSAFKALGKSLVYTKNFICCYCVNSFLVNDNEKIMNLVSSIKFLIRHWRATSSLGNVTFYVVKVCDQRFWNQAAKCAYQAFRGRNCTNFLIDRTMGFLTPLRITQAAQNLSLIWIWRLIFSKVFVLYTSPYQRYPIPLIAPRCTIHLWWYVLASLKL